MADEEGKDGEDDKEHDNEEDAYIMVIKNAGAKDGKSSYEPSSDDDGLIKFKFCLILSTYVCPGLMTHYS